MNNNEIESLERDNLKSYTIRKHIITVIFYILFTIMCLLCVYRIIGIFDNYKNAKFGTILLNILSQAGVLLVCTISLYITYILIIGLTNLTIEHSLRNLIEINKSIENKDNKGN